MCSKESCIRWSSDPPREGALLREVICRSAVKCLRMTAFLTIRLPSARGKRVHSMRKVKPDGCKVGCAASMWHIRLSLHT